LTDGENATVLGPSHGVVAKAPAACCLRGCSRHAHAAAQKHEICWSKWRSASIQAQPAASRLRNPWQKFLLNCVRTATVSGARNHVSLIRRPVVPENPIRCGFAAMAAGPTVAIPDRFFIGLGLWRPLVNLFRLDAT